MQLPAGLIIVVALVFLIIAGLWFFRRRASLRTQAEQPAARPTAPPPPPPQEEEPVEQHFMQRQHQLAAIAKEKGWTKAAYDHVLDGQIAPGMTQDMVLLAWGGPTGIDHRTTNQKGVPVERWIYQMPTTNAQQYVWFASGRVIRVEES